ncbi:hypothetical protein, unlikely [Trypanosoma brucei brucei TREU927]|uniref:Uncharacterized protein n=1 Tax=Trypanosoma brucei brucei (strain 927/4 GUTat10.1) TaxID=185431 RepID=Q4GYG8_TRYB2|nr:hypothetical protein, unlikely [Trypanosoma brucei brucei TREU927]CAJ16616.1 hypothetical protein, unlikely [Trypanosoma brucei brucei TREU927]
MCTFINVYILYTRLNFNVITNDESKIEGRDNNSRKPKQGNSSRVNKLSKKERAREGSKTKSGEVKR